MQGIIITALIFLSTASLFSTVGCDPNHHHNNHNDFPWQNILSALGIPVENQTSLISTPETDGVATGSSKDHYTSESTVEILKTENTDGNETPVIAQNGTSIEVTSSNSGYGGMSTGYKVGIPIVSILFFVCFWYCVCKCCCACCQKERPGVVVMQSNTVQSQQPAPAPQIILQQPIIHQQAPPVYDAPQRWAQPPPQWGQPPQGPQWTPHSMGQQQQYSPNSGCDNAGFNPGTAPPPYNPGKY